MNRRRVAGVLDLIEVNDPEEIKGVAHDPRLDRAFDGRTWPVNWLLLKRSLYALCYRGKRFPTMQPREDTLRARRQKELWERLSERASGLADGPFELEPLANWVSGIGLEEEVGVLAQQLLGSLFSSQFVATQESWEAATVLVAAPRSKNLPLLAWWLLSGKLRRAKRLLAGMVGNDLSAVNAIGIAVHNVVRSLRHMRAIYADASLRSSLTAEAAAEQSLFAPISLYRQATADGQVGGCPFAKGSLFVLAIGEACRRPGGRPLVFMDDSWSQCPANLWVPAMLQGVWIRAGAVRP